MSEKRVIRRVDKPEGPDGASPTGRMVLTGVVSTTRGYAVAKALVEKDGSISLSLGYSQDFKQFVAREHKRVLMEASQKA